ncbi:hypothetical protein BGZ82_007487 [Podila clonocystis]|nr:hypothetical protein BGZ82_007487 [Podila clonocystis]
MHPYLFFYFLGGVTFIPLILLVTIAVLWIRLPVIDPSLPRPTDLPPAHILLQQQREQEEWSSQERRAFRASTDSTSSSSTTTVTAITTTSDHPSSGGLSRRKSRLRSDQKSSHSPRGPSMVSGSSSPSRRPKVDSDTESGSSEDGEEDDSLSHTPKRVSSPSLGGPLPSGRKPNVPMQADPNLNKEGYVRMTRVPRLGPATETISDLMANMLFQPKNARPKDSYYAVLRYDTLFLYESDQQRDCKAVVPMNLFEVKIFPRNLPDNEVFNKEHPIQIKRKPDIIPSSSVLDNGQDEYYIFIHSPVIKEDW